MRLDPKNISLVVALVVGNLPDSFSDRKRALVTLQTLLPRDCAERDQLREMVASMNHVERLQTSLSFLPENS